jgi:hypothetical protein
MALGRFFVPRAGSAISRCADELGGRVVLREIKALLGLAPKVQPVVNYLPTVREVEARRAAQLLDPRRSFR